MITCNSSLSTFEKSRSWELAIMQLSAIRFVALEPDQISFNATAATAATAAAAATATGTWAFSLLTLQELRERGEAEAPAARIIAPLHSTTLRVLRLRMR